MTGVNEIRCPCGSDQYKIGLSQERDCEKQIVALLCVGCSDLIHVEGGDIVIDEVRPLSS